MGSTSLFDLSFIFKEIGDDPVIVREFTVVFKDVFLEYRERLNEAEQTEDIGSIGTSTHKIKPSFSMFGLQREYDLALEIEDSIRKERPFDEIKALCERMKRDFPLILKEIEERLA